MIKIAGRTIGGREPPYIVAEISGNHGGKIGVALELIRAAKEAGADAVKFQAYTPDTITLRIAKPDFIVQDGLWKGRTLYELYEKAHTPMEWLPHLFREAQTIGITAFASVFDKSSIDRLEAIGCPAYKIASFEITDIPLIDYAASKGKPLIISTGMASDREVMEAAYVAPASVFLHCTSEYPGTVERANLWRINHLNEILNHRNMIGLSDHTSCPVTVPVTATGMGIAVIEKHIKPDKGQSEDSEFSLTPKQFSLMTAAISNAWGAMQETPVAQVSRQFRRSLYAVDNIKKGEIFTESNIRSIRPGFGMAPKMLPKMLGRIATKDFRKGDPLT